MYNKPSIIIFDWDNTLIDSWYIQDFVLSKALSELGITSWDIDAAETYKHHSLKDALPHIFGDDWLRVREAYYRYFEKAHIDLLKPVENAEKVLQYFSQKGVVLSIASNKTAQYLREEVHHMNLDKYFYKIIGSGDVLHDKPCIDPIVGALKGIKEIEKERIWFIGDSPVDMECAVNFGCKPIFFQNPKVNHGVDFQIPDLKTISDLGELISIYEACSA